MRTNFSNEFKKLPAVVKIAVAFAAGIAVCYGLFYVADQVFNGMLVDWFTDRYTYERLYYDAEMGENVTASFINWPEVKSLIFTVICLLQALFIGAVFLAARISAVRERKKTIIRTDEMIRIYMDNEMDAGDAFPDAYAQVAARMVQIKAGIKESEQAMREEAAKKNDLITYLAHDLKTPLTSVIGYLSLLDEAPELPEKQRGRYIHITLEKAVRLEKLINEFFDITRYNFNQIVLEKERIDLSYMLVQLADEFYPLLEANHNTAELQVEEKLAVVGDPDKLARVFNNILKNAAAYSYQDTPIRIWTQKEEKGVKICFKNQGKTIPEEKLHIIFKKFYRLDSSRSGNTGGAGLGLAIASDIVKLHGGEIFVESRDQYTTFTVFLPWQ